MRDAAGRVLYQTNGNNEALRFTYNPADELLTLADGKNQTTTWGYDTFGRVTNKLDASGTNLFAYQYDQLNRLTNRWSIAKSNTVYRYDPVGNLTNIAYIHSTNIILRYDGLNHLTNMVDGVGSTAFSWTDGDQLAAETGPWANDAVNYTYSARLRQTLNLAQPNASPWIQSYGYDAAMRLTNVVSAAGQFGYEYADGAFDLLYLLHLPNGSQVNDQFDGLARLTRTELDTPLLSLVDEHQYSYDAGSQRTQQVFAASQARSLMNYSYDNIGQLKSAQGYEYGGTTPRLQEQFGYERR